MKILFLHANFPAQFRDLALVCARDPQCEVVFITACAERALRNVRKVLYTPARPPSPDSHPYLRVLEQATLHGQAAYRAADSLKREGWVPDVIYGHSGFGPTLFMKDLYPQTPLLCHFEWYYRSRGADVGFDSAEPLSPDLEARIRMKNAAILTDLAACDAGCTPTAWQQSQFPPEFHSKITVMHEGIDTVFFQPVRRPLVLPRLGLDLTAAPEVITYVARGLEPYRGFPRFMALAERLQRERPACHFVIVGEDRCAYGRPRADGRTYQTAAQEDLKLDPARTHFTGPLSYPEYRAVLQASSVHVYLTVPFVLSWSLLEAMACGCNIVASDTSPVREVITDGREGLMVDFFDIGTMAVRVTEALDRPVESEQRRAHARETVMNRFALRHLLPQKLRWLKAKSLGVKG